MNQKTLFITGCRSGFGLVLSKMALEQGHRVIATDPDLSALQGLLASDSDQLLTLQLDVTDQAMVDAAAIAAQKFGGVDVLVNNGGYAFFETIEEGDADKFNQMFNVNVTGSVRVLQALMPQLRARSGTVVALSSVAAKVVFPESGFYAATKFALEAIHEALVQECASFNVKVRIIRPGSFNTNFLATAIANSQDRSQGSVYAPQYDDWDKRKCSVLESPQDPELVAEAILASLVREEPYLRIPVGLDSVRLLKNRENQPPAGWSDYEFTR